jgi:hypothetical protein
MNVLQVDLKRLNVSPVKSQLTEVDMAEPSKALFRCLLAFSNGRPVASFEVNEDQPPGTLCATRNSEVAVKVAYVRASCSAYFEPCECPGSLTEAYEIFVRDGKESGVLEWARLEEM